MISLTPEFLLSLWGAVLSTLLALGALANAMRARPILSVKAQISEKSASDEPQFIVFEKPAGPYGETYPVEICAQFTVTNSGEKDIWLNAVFVETASHVKLVRPNGLPQVILARSFLEIEVQKELFDDIDLTLEERKMSEVVAAGVIDALGKRHSISKSNLSSLLKDSFEAPTSMSVYRRKGAPSERFLAYQVCHDMKTLRKK